MLLSDSHPYMGVTTTIMGIEALRAGEPMVIRMQPSKVLDIRATYPDGSPAAGSMVFINHLSGEFRHQGGYDVLGPDGKLRMPVSHIVSEEDAVLIGSVIPLGEQVIHIHANPLWAELTVEDETNKRVGTTHTHAADVLLPAVNPRARLDLTLHEVVTVSIEVRFPPDCTAEYSSQIFDALGDVITPKGSNLGTMGHHTVRAFPLPAGDHRLTFSRPACGDLPAASLTHTMPENAKSPYDLTVDLRTDPPTVLAPGR